MVGRGRGSRGDADHSINMSAASAALPPAVASAVVSAAAAAAATSAHQQMSFARSQRCEEHRSAPVVKH